MTLNKLTLATRRSLLAKRQAQLVVDRVQAHTNIACDVTEVTSEGDQLAQATLAHYGGKGLFTRSLDRIVMSQQADIAVHSLKDIPVVYPDELCFAAFLPREDPRDAWVSNRYQSFDELPGGSVVGTSSLRRQSLVKSMRPELCVEPIRGGVDTRLHKLDRGDYDALILAASGLKRLNMASRINHYLGLNNGFLPGVGQGTIVVTCQRERSDLLAVLQSVDDPFSRYCALAERSFIYHMGGDCFMPIAANCRIYDRMMYISGMVATPDGQVLLKAWDYDDMQQYLELGKRLSIKLKQQGADKILEKSRANH